MPFLLKHGDITKIRTDAIVNAANRTLLGGGVDGCIHRAAGPELLEECRTLGGCETGQAKITRGYGLPAKHVIHTVGPVWRGGGNGEEDLLRGCYRNSLMLAVQNGCESIAFPLISAGIYGYPKDLALRVAEETIAEFLQKEDLTVYLILFSRRDFVLPEQTAAAIEEICCDYSLSEENDVCDSFEKADKYLCANMIASRPKMVGNMKPHAAKETMRIEELDESFQQMLFRKIDELGMTDAECYRRANIDRRLFSKIRSDAHYSPSKQTALAFAVGMELPLRETEELLKKAGLALSDSILFDVIVKHFISNEEYSILDINNALFAKDQPLLGNAAR